MADEPVLGCVPGPHGRGSRSDLKLGQGQGTDFLAVSFSALDTVGHAYGPRSHEVQDILVRLDATIGRCCPTWTASSAAAGMRSPSPQITASVRFPSRCRPSALAEVGGSEGRDHGPDRRRSGAASSTATRGPRSTCRRTRQRNWPRSTSTSGTPSGRRSSRSTDRPRLAYQRPAAGRRGRLRPVAHAARLSAFVGRSGDIIYITDPYWFPYRSSPRGTPYQYDQQCHSSSPDRSSGAAATPPCRSADVAPTLGRLLGVILPASDGTTGWMPCAVAPEWPPSTSRRRPRRGARRRRRALSVSATTRTMQRQ